MRIEFNEEDHTYKVDGVDRPSVTTVLDSVFPTRFFCSQEKLERAAAFGRAAHLMLQFWGDGALDEDVLDPSLRLILTQAKEAFKANGWRICSTEQRVAHELYGYAGTVDAIVMDGKQSTGPVDYKTGAKSWKTALQTAAYAETQKEKGVKIKFRAALYLTTESYKVEFFKESTDFNNFLSALNVHKLKELHHV